MHTNRKLLAIDAIWEKWEHALGLNAILRKSWLLRQELSDRSTTEYSIELEWAPYSGKNGEGEEDADGLAEPGTVCVSIDAETERLRSYRIVRGGQRKGSDEDPAGAADATEGKSTVSGDVQHFPLSAEEGRGLVLDWLTLHAGYARHAERLQLMKEQQREDGGYSYRFRGVVRQIPLYPSHAIVVETDIDGAVIAFHSYGAGAGEDDLFPDSDCHEPEAAAISEAARGCCKLVRVPESMGEARWVYGLEETFVDFRTGETVPYELNVRYMLEKPWDMPIVWTSEPGEGEKQAAKPFASPRNGHMGERLRQFAAEREIREPYIDEGAKHPDSEPIREEERERIYTAVQSWAKAAKPDESGQWEIRRAMRWNGMISVIVSRSDAAYAELFGKIKVLLEPFDYAIIDVMEAASLTAPAVPEGLIGSEEAWATLAEHVTAMPYFVWDPGQTRYRLLHLLDCQKFVDGVTGARLDDL
ncbi:hypothetical protein ACFFNY_31540 [Paenibacillus hodogayensis]|uniref:Uncharacterized protein n=1 Tax=Paenibacillus hodogayensis TaxID=279208 RepID=A0ABV5W6K5_9BACL